MTLPNHLLTRGYKLRRIAIEIESDAGYTVYGTYSAVGVDDEIIVADRLTWDEMLGALASATFPADRLKGGQTSMFFGRALPRCAAREMQKSGRT